MWSFDEKKVWSFDVQYQHEWSFDYDDTNDNEFGG